jgi:hypothetical protein
MNRIKNPSLWLISKTYLKKLEQFNNLQAQVQEPSEESVKARKISWSE